MHIDAAVFRDLQQSFRQDLTEGDHHDQVGFHLPHDVDEFGGPHLERLEDRQAVTFGKLFHRWRQKFLSPPLRPVRLGNHGKDLFSPVDEPLQCRAGKIRRSHEDNTQSGH